MRLASAPTQPGPAKKSSSQKSAFSRRRPPRLALHAKSSPSPTTPAPTTAALTTTRLRPLRSCPLRQCAADAATWKFFHVRPAMYDVDAHPCTCLAPPTYVTVFHLRVSFTTPQDQPADETANHAETTTAINKHAETSLRSTNTQRRHCDQQTRRDDTAINKLPGA
jgi:hypothetical protein